MAITINGKTYRNLQEQVAKNQEDIANNKTDILENGEAISDLQELVSHKQNTLTAGKNVTIQDNVISVEQLSDENEEYACSLIVNPDGAILNYTEYDEEHIGQTTSYDLVSTAYNTNVLVNRHLYEHNIFINVKGHDGGVLKDDFTGTVMLTYITNNATKYDTTTSIYTLLSNLQSHEATGYMKYDTNQRMYVVYGIRGRSDGESIDVLASYGDYTPAGSTENKCIVTFVSDRVRTLF